MEFGSGNKGSKRLKLRQVQIARRLKQRGEMNGTEVKAWSRAWLMAWPQAKMLAMEAEEVRQFEGQFEQRWAEAWARVEPNVGSEVEWTEAKARTEEIRRAEVEWATMLARTKALADTKEAGVEGTAVLALDMWGRMEAQRNMWSELRREREREIQAEAKAKVEALALAEVWVRVRGEPQNDGSVPSIHSTLADPSTIGAILSDLNRYGLTNDLWHCSHETRGEYTCIINFIAPITRLPPELLCQIFLIIIDDASGQPWALMLVCKYWHVMVTSIWASLSLGASQASWKGTNGFWM